MAALVSLACCLSGNAKLCGNLRPADPEVDCTVDEGVKLGLCRVARQCHVVKGAAAASRKIV
jgi:hypothetical protein